MEINVDITREDYASFNKYWVFKKRKNISVLVVLIFAFGFSYIIDYKPPFEFLKYLINVIFIGFVFGFFYFLVMLMLMELTKYLPSEGGAVLGKRKFIITDEGLYEETKNGKSFQEWNGIKDIEVNKKHIFVFVDNVAAYIIPKRYFSNQEEQKKYINSLKKCLGKSQLLNKQ